MMRAKHNNPNAELRPILLYSQQYLELRVTSFEFAIICPEITIIFQAWMESGQARVGLGPVAT